MTGYPKEKYHPCLSCNDVMIGIFKPSSDNHNSVRVAREICYECSEIEKMRKENAA